MRHRLVAATAAALLASTLAACNNDPKPEATTLEPAPTGSATPSATTQAASSDPAQSDDCALPEGDQAIPKTAPAVDEWVDVQGFGVPTSSTYGPTKREGDLFTCYAHSPTGALFASAYAFSAAGRVPGFAENWYPEGEYRERGKTAENEQNGSPAPSMTIQGYQFESATSDKVIVNLAVSASNDSGAPVLMSKKMGLQWAGDHWEVDTVATGEQPHQIDATMQGFTPWSANG